MPNIKVGRVLIGPDIPSGRPASEWGNFIWIDTVNRQVKHFDGAAWVVDVDFSDTFSTEGYTGEIKDGKNTFVFENGILIKYG